MLQVKSLSRETIDAWPIAESGLPVRVVNSVTSAKAARIGDLRTWSDQDLLSLRSLGRISLGHIRAFFKLCGQIEQGKQSFQNVREVFSIFLDEAELKVLAARYGFDRKDLGASSNCATLQQIGDAENKTRERIRQVQETAMHQLQSRLSTVCLQPFTDYFISYMDKLGKVASCADLAPMQTDPALAGFNVCSVLLLLSDLSPARITFHHDFFSTLPQSVLRDVETRALAVLQREGKPVPLDRLLEDIPAIPGLENAEHRRRCTAYVVDHCPSAAATLDQRYFLYAHGTRAFLVEILRDLDRPVHYRTVTNIFNERLKPLSRKGAGFILEMLNANPQCTRVDRGIYDLKAQ